MQMWIHLTINKTKATKLFLWQELLGANISLFWLLIRLSIKGRRVLPLLQSKSNISPKIERWKKKKKSKAPLKTLLKSVTDVLMTRTLDIRILNYRTHEPNRSLKFFGVTFLYKSPDRGMFTFSSRVKSVQAICGSALWESLSESNRSLQRSELDNSWWYLQHLQTF